MAQQTNIPTENERNYRDITRNTSNQIVSYTLPTDADGLTEIDYGKSKVKGITLKYEKDGFNRTVGGLSNELKMTLPDVPLEVIELKRVSEAKIYVNGVSIDGVGNEPFEDTFSGRYELTEGAKSFRTKKMIDYPNATLDGWKDSGTSSPAENTHMIPPSYLSSSVRKRPEGFRTAGYGVLPFDGVVKGPNLEDGKYRVTQELIDSGRDLFIKVTVGLMNVTNKYGAPEPYPILYKLRLRQRILPWGGSQALANETEVSKQVEQWTWPYLETEGKVLNADLRLNSEIFVEHYCTTGYGGFAVMGDKSILEIKAVDPIEDFTWPTNTTNTSQIYNRDNDTEVEAIDNSSQTAS